METKDVIARSETTQQSIKHEDTLLRSARNNIKDGIYMDNAATSFPKPESVEKALLDYHRNIGASAGRGAYPRAIAAGRLLDETRKILGRLFNVQKPEQFIFTFNASDALNLAIKG